MRIAICDDEEYFVEYIREILWHELDNQIDTFLNPVDLLQKYQEGATYDVIFCDIMMEPYDGIETARRIRALDSNVILVYLTSNLEYAPLGYEVHAFRYLLKPVTKEALFSVMQEVKKELCPPSKILLKTPDGSFLIPWEEILYLETTDKDTQIFFENDTYSLRKGLNEFEEELSAFPFYRIHRKYLVNLTHIREFDDTRLTLDNGVTLSISRRKSKGFQNSFEQYLRGGLR
ncbi:MAG: LytTR family DNA-binding domain-containing protein [Lachnospiraceae bacterium]|nr:LytTR family DNA-binding domain-containing protein [Lachnospiraceae bacterium]